MHLPVQVQFRNDRDAALSFAMTLDPKSSPYLIVAFGTRGVPSPTQWASKKTLTSNLVKCRLIR